MRRVASWVLVVLASVALLLSVGAVWLHLVLLNTEQFVATVQPIVRDQAVQAALGERVSEEIVAALDVQQRAAAALPEQARFLAPPLSRAAESLVDRQMQRILATDAFWQAATRMLTFTHQQLVTLLRDQGRLLRTSDGEVTLDFTPLVDLALSRLDGTGLLPDRAASWRQGGGELPEETRRRLEQAIGRPLPADFGQIVLFESDQVALAQQLVSLADTLVWVLPLLTLGLAAAAMLCSVSRRQTAVGLAAGGAICLLLPMLLAWLIQPRILDALPPDTLGQAVVAAALPALFGSFITIANLTALVLVLLLVALLAFPALRERGTSSFA